MVIRVIWLLKGTALWEMKALCTKIKKLPFPISPMGLAQRLWWLNAHH